MCPGYQCRRKVLCVLELELNPSPERAVLSAQAARGVAGAMGTWGTCMVHGELDPRLA